MIEKKEPIHKFTVGKGKNQLEVHVYQSRRPDGESYNHDRHKHFELVATTAGGGMQIGRAEYGCSPINAYLSFFVVEPEYRKKGIGTKFFEVVTRQVLSLEREMRPRYPGVHAYLEPKKDMREAIEKLLEKGGFKKDGEGYLLPTERTKEEEDWAKSPEEMRQE